MFVLAGGNLNLDKQELFMTLGKKSGCLEIITSCSFNLSPTNLSFIEGQFLFIDLNFFKKYTP